MNIRKIIREEINDFDWSENPIEVGNSINESDDLQWVKDIKSNQDIAQEIADETYIKDNEIYAPFVGEGSKWSRWLNKEIFLTSYRYFHDYCEKHHGLTDVVITHDIWNRYKKMVMDKINNHNLNENDELKWIKDIKPIPELKIGTCFIDVMDSTKTEWIIIDFKMTPGGTHIVVIKNKKNNVDIRHKHEGYFEEDLLTGRYKPC
jgi:hypothetical protein